MLIKEEFLPSVRMNSINASRSKLIVLRIAKLISDFRSFFSFLISSLLFLFFFSLSDFRVSFHQLRLIIRVPFPEDLVPSSL